MDLGQCRDVAGGEHSWVGGGHPVVDHDVPTPIGLHSGRFKTEPGGVASTAGATRSWSASIRSFVPSIVMSTQRRSALRPALVTVAEVRTRSPRDSRCSSRAAEISGSSKGGGPEERLDESDPAAQMQEELAVLEAAGSGADHDRLAGHLREVEGGSGGSNVTTGRRSGIHCFTCPLTAHWSVVLIGPKGPNPGRNLAGIVTCWFGLALALVWRSRQGG
ncbi:MAG: hypothetical protein ACRDWA_10845 [Acidimicrobiia bacterium]